MGRDNETITERNETCLRLRLRLRLRLASRSTDTAPKRALDVDVDVDVDNDSARSVQVQGVLGALYVQTRGQESALALSATGSEQVAYS